MGKTPVNRQIIDNLAQEMGVTDFSRATIREIKAIASKAEAASGVEFIKMLCRHSVQNVVEVLLFATARQMVVEHLETWQTLIGVAAIAILFAIRKYLMTGDERL